MTKPIYFAPLRVPLVDLETGLISHPWQLLFQGMFNRSGGTNGVSIADVLARLASDEQAAGQVPPMIPSVAPDDQSPPMIQGIAPDDQSPVMISVATFDDLLGELRQTREIVAELAKQLQGLQQGTVSL